MENLCPQCGAPAKRFEPDVSRYTCQFCSTEYDVRHPKREEFLRAKKEKERAAEREEKEREKRERKKTEARSEKVGAIVPVLVVGGIFAFAGGITYYEEYIKPNQWDGHASFRCSKGTFTFKDVQATNKVDASGNCQVTLIKPQLESKIIASDHAVVTVTGGRVHNTSNAIEASGFAKVTLDGTTVDGKISSSGSAVIESKNGAKVTGKYTYDSPANLVGFDLAAASATTTSTSPNVVPNPPSTRSKPWDPGSRACTGITNCYKTFTGQIQGHLVMTIDASGSVTNVAYTGTATADQKKCLTDLGKTKAFTAADPQIPGAGQLVCDYAGTVTPGTQMMNTSGSFKPSK